jgi:hypothetical protein
MIRLKYSILSILIFLSALTSPAQTQVIRNNSYVNQPEYPSICSLNPNFNLPYGKPIYVTGINGQTNVVILDKNYTNPTSNVISSILGASQNKKEYLYFSIFFSDGFLFDMFDKNQRNDRWQPQDVYASDYKFFLKIEGILFPLEKKGVAEICTYGKEKKYWYETYDYAPFIIYIPEYVREHLASVREGNRISIVFEKQVGNTIQSTETDIGYKTIENWKKVFNN